MSDPTKPQLEDLETATDLAYKAMREHFANGGAPVLNKEGEVVGRAVNAQILACLLREAGRHNIGVAVTKGSPGESLFKAAASRVDGLEFTFPDDPSIPPHLRQ